MSIRALRPSRWLAALVAAALLLGSTTPTLARVEKIGKGEGFVDIVAWPGYIERGDTDPSLDWVTAFEKKAGVRSA